MGKSNYVPAALASACLPVLIAVFVPCQQAIAGADSFDVLMRMVARPTPSSQAMVTGSDLELKMLLGHQETFSMGDSVILEVWVSDVGSVNTGVTGFFTDIFFDAALLRADATFHTPGQFTLLTGGIINNVAGRVDNFGGNDGSFAGQASEPTWARVGYIQMTAIGLGSSTITSDLGIGGIGTLGRQPPAEAEIDFDTITLMVPEPSFMTFMLLGIAGALRPFRTFRKHAAKESAPTGEKLVPHLGEFA